MSEEKIKELVDLMFNFDEKELEKETDFLKEYKKIKEERDKYKEVLDKIKEKINKQLLSNTNLTKYTDEQCLKDILELLEEIE